MELPTTMSMAEKPSLNRLAWCIYGQPGIGKSTLFSKFPNALFLYTDPGLTFISAFKQPLLKWQDFKDAVKLLVAQPKPIYGIVVIDTVDLLYSMCVDSVCRARGIEHVSDEQWGKGYDIIDREFKVPIQQLVQLKDRGCGVAFISHATDIELRGRIVKTSKIIPAMKKGARTIILPLCDVIGYCGFSRSKSDDADTNSPRYLFFKPDETLEAKDRTKILPEKCLLNITSLKACFNNAPAVAKAPVAVQPKPAPKKVIGRKI